MRYEWRSRRIMRIMTMGCRVNDWRGGIRVGISVVRPFRLAVPY